MEMKLPGQEGFEASSAPTNVSAGELDSDLGPSPGPSPDGPSDTESKELGVPKDPLLFIQLNELLGWPQALEWRETGSSSASRLLDMGEMPPITLSTHLHCRWVLFEEKLEVAAGRWSAPHVPTLALPSLQKLRNLLAEGLVLLDCPAQSLLELRQNPLRQKLPPGAEAGTVLAGELGFLAQPLGAFVRLRDPVVLGSLTEVSLPSRSELSVRGQGCPVGTQLVNLWGLVSSSGFSAFSWAPLCWEKATMKWPGQQLSSSVTR
ncbi:Anion exchange protein 4 [Saguinus oedipus]|uniref:Anion exchange protein 4 n=1 Tax=Saguinus oedipus TaxID=9490 RepID=A0ABQ9W622_SAGOE|nr:Anion exchange protein 4 [Saguinus oedipus]